VLALALAACDRVFSLPPPGLDGDAANDAITDTTVDGKDRGLRLVQDKAHGVQSGTSLSFDLDAAPTLGNVLILVGGAELGALARPTGGGVTTWSLAMQSFNSQNLEIYYGVVDAPNGPIRITANAAAGRIRMSVSEWSGLDTAAPFEDAVVNEGMASPGTAGPLTIRDTPDLLIFGVASTGSIGLTTVMGGETGKGWTRLKPTPQVSSLYQAVWYQVLSGPGIHSGQVDVAGVWDAGLAAFRIAP
jgi:hypothetical protein